MLPGQKRKPSNFLSGRGKRLERSNEPKDTISNTTSGIVRPDTTNDAEPIWNIPGLQKDQFYAAAFYLSRVQRSQERLDWKQKEMHYPNPETTNTEKELLDGVALLFARVKNPPELKPQHVTATAMSKTDKGLMIHVAKNNGPEPEDIDFARELSSLFSKKPSGPVPNIMKHFWKNRSEFYKQNLAPIWKRLEKKHDELTGIYRGTSVDSGLFKDDWEDIASLIGSRKSDSSLIGYKLLEIGRQDYPKLGPESDSPQKLANDFRKLVKYIKLLGTVPRVWRILVNYRHHIEGTIQFDCIQAPRKFPLDPIPIADTMESWDGVRKNSEGEVSKFWEEKENAVKELRERPMINRYFHCELQLLDNFIAANNVFDYFGCSKLSCFICWGVLDGTPYRTKNTHAKVYPTCAFPFGISEGDRQVRLMRAMRSVQNYLLERVFRMAIDPDHNVTDHQIWSETNPLEAPLRLSAVGPIQNTQELVIQRKALKIPQAGEPTIELVTLHDIERSSRTLYEPIAKSSIQEVCFWVSKTDPIIVRRRWFKFILSLKCEAQVELDLALYCQLRDESGMYLPNNEWCVRGVNGGADLHNWVDASDESFPWKGNLYLFTNMDMIGTDHWPVDINEHNSEEDILQEFVSNYCRHWKHYRNRVFKKENMG